MNLAKLVKGEPTFVNEQGVKWWLDHSATRWATEERQDGPGLKDTAVFLVEELSGQRTYIIVKDSKIEYTSNSYETIAVHIDILRLAQNS